MDNRYIDVVINEMKPFLDENGFSSCDGGGYKNGKREIKVSYSDERQMYILLIADIDDEGNVGEFSEKAAWLFDDSQNQKDAESVGIDFTETLRQNMGITVKRSSASNVELPTASKGDTYNISSFTKKALDTYPQLKDAYKEYVSKYGNFLYLNFFGEYLVPSVKSTLGEKTKKSQKKILDLVSEAYVSGDKETVNAVVAVIAAACYKDSEATETVNGIFADNLHLKSAVASFVSVLNKKKKIREILIK